MDATRMILNGTLRPNLPDRHGEDYWGPEFNQLEMPLETFIHHYEIKFKVPPFTYKLKYYTKLIDAAAIKELNELFHKYYKASDSIIVYQLMQLRRTTDSRIQEIYKLIVAGNHDIDVLNGPGVNFKDNTQHKEATYIYHYLLQALIKVYLEFQFHFDKQIIESKKRSYEDFFLLKLGIPAPENNRLIEVATDPKAEPAKKPVGDRSRGKKGFWLSYDIKDKSSPFLVNIWMGLESGKFIKSGTTLDEVKEIFAGKQVKKKVVWIAGKTLLSYFVKQLYKTDFINDEGSKWVAASNCFTDEQGTFFVPNSLKDEKKPKLRASEVDDIINEAINSMR